MGDLPDERGGVLQFRVQEVRGVEGELVVQPHSARRACWFLARAANEIFFVMPGWLVLGIVL
jgi:hypothetical protein